jgi:hypothetical protein
MARKAGGRGTGAGAGRPDAAPAGWSGYRVRICSLSGASGKWPALLRHVECSYFGRDVSRVWAPVEHNRQDVEGIFPYWKLPRGASHAKPLRVSSHPQQERKLHAVAELTPDSMNELPHPQHPSALPLRGLYMDGCPRSCESYSLSYCASC